MLSLPVIPVVTISAQIVSLDARVVLRRVLIEQVGLQRARDVLLLHERFDILTYCPFLSVTITV